ncbi:hypothetical protein [Lysobacter capsici]|uniref:hypothetical protein n=1 Tax=Lysobacter capsici TaxID=435897 RepID=UPI00165128C7|nr:hypothetical protein [Lysobacter capsici]
MKTEIGTEVAAASGKVAPAAAVVVASTQGWGIQEWMYAATIVYVLAQLGYLLWKWWREAWQAPLK